MLSLSLKITWSNPSENIIIFIIFCACVCVCVCVTEKGFKHKGAVYWAPSKEMLDT